MSEPNVSLNWLINVLLDIDVNHPTAKVWFCKVGKDGIVETTMSLMEIYPDGDHTVPEIIFKLKED